MHRAKEAKVLHNVRVTKIASSTSDLMIWWLKSTDELFTCALEQKTKKRRFCGIDEARAFEVIMFAVDYRDVCTCGGVNLEIAGRPVKHFY